MNRHDTIQAAQTRDHLARFPQLQPEAIAHHYATHASAALTLLELCRARQFGAKPDVSLDALIERATANIRAAHARDLGIALEWPDESAEQLHRDADVQLAEDKRMEENLRMSSVQALVRRYPEPNTL